MKNKFDLRNIALKEIGAQVIDLANHSRDWLMAKAWKRGFLCMAAKETGGSVMLLNIPNLELRIEVFVPTDGFVRIVNDDMDAAKS